MRTWFHQLLAGLLLVGAGAASAHAQRAGACRPADSVSARMVSSLTRVATGTDALNAKKRAIMGLPQVAASQVVYVTNKAVCSKLVSPYNAKTTYQPPVQPSGKLYVVQIGSMYGAWDPVKTIEAHADFIVFDGKYKFGSANMY